MLYISLSLSALSTLLALIALWNLGTYRMLKKQDTYQASAMYASLRRIALSLIALTASTVVRQSVS